MTAQRWAVGDRVVHPARPEWGAGEVLLANSATQDGKPCQRLEVRFERAGLKTLSTAHVELKPTSSVEPVPVGETIAEDPLTLAATKGEIEERMTKLPDEATDPFLSLAKRAKHSLGLYRFGETPGGLLDWATAQTGLKDPLVRFNRHELEQWFTRFRMGLDTHMKKLLRDLKREDPRAAEELFSGASPAARQALRRANG
jgi:hypothetical protein